MKSHIQKILGSALTLFFAFLAIPFPADALFFLGPLAVAAIAYAVLYILQYIGAMFFSLAGYLVGFFLDFNYQILSPNNMVVTIGWEITRDIANLGFVLVIIIIALATIIRYQDYGAKKLLPRLIGAALLVNFSLSLAGVFIGFSHVITRYFFNAVAEKDNIVDLVKTLSGAFDPQALFTEPSEPEPVDPDEEAGGLSGFGTAVLMNITGLFFVVIFTFIASFVLLAFALMLLIRYVALSFLMILAPIAWLFWVIPSLESQFSKWWSRFLKWVFFAPAVSFFFYLALVSIGRMKQGTGAVTPTQFFKNGFISAMMQQGARMAILIGLLIGGLMVADSMGTTGAKGAMNLLNKGVDKSKKWLGAKAKEGATRAATAPLRTDTGRSFVNKLQTLGKDSKWGGAAAPLRMMGSSLAGVTAKAEQQYQTTKAKFEKMSTEKIAAGHANANDEERAAGVDVIAERGKKIGDALIDAEKEIERSVRALEKAKESGDQNSIVAAEERLDKANEKKGAVKKEQYQYEEALKNLPANTRDGIGNIGQYVSDKQNKVPTKQFDIANITTKEDGVLFRRTKRGARYIATRKAPTEGELNDARQAIPSAQNKLNASVANAATARTNLAGFRTARTTAEADKRNAQIEHDRFANQKTFNQADENARLNNLAAAKRRLDNATQQTKDIEEEIKDTEQKIREETKARDDLAKAQQKLQNLERQNREGWRRKEHKP
jgi:hypothetical protein